MRTLRRLLPFALIPLGLALMIALLGRGPSVYADEKPGGGEPGMGDPAMADPAMGDPGMGDPAMDDAKDPDDEDDVPEAIGVQVEKAIKKGVNWLKAHQLADGSWGLIEGNQFYGGKKDGVEYKHPAGATALALYTLLKCKEPVEDPVVKKGFAYLKGKYKQPGSAYETSMMLLAVTATADPFKKFSASRAQGDKVKLTGEMREWAQKLHDYLIKKRDKFKTNGWRYMLEGPNLKGDTPPGGNEDMSSTQLAALALLACERCEIKTEGKVWNDIVTFTMRQQQDDGPEWDRAVYTKDNLPKPVAGSGPAPGGQDPDKGRYAKPPPPEKAVKDKARGFSYIKNDQLTPDESNPTGGMTACGVGNLQMARYIMGKRPEDKGWAERDQKGILQSVYDGCAWLDANWSPFENPGKSKGENVYHIYYMYCCERAFDLIGNQLVGHHHWYNEMAEQLVGLQKDKGFWDSQSTHKPREVLDTCFALLVLKRSTKGGIPYGSITNPGDEPPADNRGK